jgi:hypothetical protein
MDWNATIEKNREALKRVLAMLVAMAGLGGLSSPLAGEDGSARRGDLSAEAQRAKAEAEPLAEPGEGSGSRATLPRHLHRAVLRLLRPAESAARRLVIALACWLPAPPAACPRKTVPAKSTRAGTRKTSSLLVRNGVGTGIVLRPGAPVPAHLAHLVPSKAAPRPLSFPLLDPLPRWNRRRPRPRAAGVPRIGMGGIGERLAVPAWKPPSSDDPLDAGRLRRRLAALSSALDDLPGQARRFMRWKARRDRALGAGRIHRVTPLRGGRPPGGRLARYDPDARRRANIRDVDEILAHAHALAHHALRPDTS